MSDLFHLKSIHPLWKIHYKSATEGVSLLILSQWALFSMSARNFTGFGESATNLLQNDKRTACSALTRGSCVFNMREHCVPLNTSIRSGIYAHDDRHAVIYG